MLFFRDSTDSVGRRDDPAIVVGLQYVDLATGEWRERRDRRRYGRSSDAMNEVTFAAVTTTKLRALMQAWGADEAGGSSGILEFEAWAVEGKNRMSQRQP